jgi:acyl-CoA reductase-like NAD-dependent aldehyde dehydrogenase
MTIAADLGTDLDRTRFFIDGAWVEPRGTETHRALEAATGEPLVHRRARHRRRGQGRPPLIRRVTLELSGKSAAIFLDDGDIDVFLAGLGRRRS